MYTVGKFYNHTLGKEIMNRLGNIRLLTDQMLIDLAFEEFQGFVRGIYFLKIITFGQRDALIQLARNAARYDCDKTPNWCDLSSDVTKILFRWRK